MDRVAGPSKEILVPGGYVKHFVCNMPQEDCDLQGHDESSFTGGVVAINHGGVVRRRAEPTCASDNVQARLSRAKPMRVRSAPVGQGLAIVIVFEAE